MVLSFRTSVLGAVLAASLITAPLRGDEPKRDPAAAEALFKIGLDHLEREDWAVACEKFAASMALDPSVGAQINIARCAEHDGKLATAWAEYKKARALNRGTASEVRRKEVDAFVDERVQKLEPRLAHLTIDVKNAPPGVRVRRNGVELPPGARSEAIPVDPGKHVIEIDAPGYQPETRQIETREGDKQAVSVELVPAKGPEKPTPSKPSTEGPDVAPGPADDDAGPNGEIIAGVVIGVVGLAAFGGFAGFHVAARGAREDMLAVEGCGQASDGTLPCGTPEAEAAAEGLRDDGTMFNTLGGVMIGVGIAAVGAGATLIIHGALSDDDEAPPTVTLVPIVGSQTIGLGISGRWGAW